MNASGGVENARSACVSPVWRRPISDSRPTTAVTNLPGCASRYCACVRRASVRSERSSPPVTASQPSGVSKEAVSGEKVSSAGCGYHAVRLL